MQPHRTDSKRTTMSSSITLQQREKGQALGPLVDCSCALGPKDDIGQGLPVQIAHYQGPAYTYLSDNMLCVYSLPVTRRSDVAISLRSPLPRLHVSLIEATR